MAMMHPEVHLTRLLPWKSFVVTWVKGCWPDLTNRQMALLMIVALEDGSHSVGSLAGRLGVAPPIVSRILDRLSSSGLILRQTDRRDRRTVFVVPTQQAFNFLDDLGASIPIDGYDDVTPSVPGYS